MPERWTPTLDDFVDLAGVVLGAPEEAVRRLPRLPLAESAIAAPFASFGGKDAYPSLTEQAAVLITHLAQNWNGPRFSDSVGLSVLVDAAASTSDGTARAWLAATRSWQQRGRPRSGAGGRSSAGGEVPSCRAAFRHPDSLLDLNGPRTRPGAHERQRQQLA